jgi:hypothetical protein
MSADLPYVDTSALAKWYLNEAGSAEFVDFMRAQGRALISRLTVVELRSLLARRERSGEITAAYQRDAVRTLERTFAKASCRSSPCLTFRP